MGISSEALDFEFNREIQLFLDQRHERIRAARPLSVLIPKNTLAIKYFCKKLKRIPQKAMFTQIKYISTVLDIPRYSLFGIDEKEWKKDGNDSDF